MGCIILEEKYFVEEEIAKLKALIQETGVGQPFSVYVVTEETDTEMLRRKCFAYYHFEDNLIFWNKLFSVYGEERLVQCAFLHDYIWKMVSNVLWPYHYEESQLKQKQWEYHQNLRLIPNELILKMEGIDTFQRYYFLSLKSGNDFKISANPGKLDILCNNEVYYTAKKLELILTKYHPIGEDELEITAFLKSPVFSFCGKPQIYVEENGNTEGRRKIHIESSSWNYYKTKEEICRFYRFVYRVNIHEVEKFHFYVRIKETEYDTYYYFMPDIVFNTKLDRYRYYQNGFVYRFESNTFYIQKCSAQESQKYYERFQNMFLQSDKEVADFRDKIYNKRKKSGRIWLYYDCKGVYKDNGYYQFVYDCQKEDGIERYYILNDDLESREELFDSGLKEKVISFGSGKHKELYCLAEKIITAYAEKNNYLPFSDGEYQKVMDVAAIPEIIYLQHGVYHAHIPWKYSVDRMQIDKIVVSTVFEYENYKKISGFQDFQLMKTCMPRNDFIDYGVQPEKKILYAPSWRKYLVGVESGEWATREDLFLDSSFYKETQAFLQNKKLRRFLKFHHYTMEFKLHPILRRYVSLYELDGVTIKMAEETVNESEYCLFITDFSNYVFDFAYLEQKIIYYFPDYDEFRSGMSDYRESEYPFEGGIGDFTTDIKSLIKQIKYAVRHKCEPLEEQREKMKNMYFYKDDHARERIYSCLFEE